MNVAPKNETSQKGDGSPAQIWGELSVLASDIFGTIQMAQKFAMRFEEINETAVSPARVPGLPGFKGPTAECDTISTHSTPHTAHRTMI